MTACQGKRLVQSPDERCGSAVPRHQGADQKAESHSEIAPDTIRRDLHAYWVDAGQEEPGRKARDDQQRDASFEKIGRPLLAAPSRSRPEGRARRASIGNSQHGEYQRAGDETQLYSGRHVAKEAVR